MERTFHVNARDWDQAIQTLIKYLGGWDELDSQDTDLYNFMYYFAAMDLERYIDTHNDSWLVDKNKYDIIR